MELVVTNCLHIGQPQLLLVDPQLHQGVVLGDAVVLAIPSSRPDELQRIGPIIIIPPQSGILAVGQVVEVLVEKDSKRSNLHWSGRNSQNTVVVFPKENYKPGDFVNVKITDCTAATLIGEAVGYSEIMN